jgi:hypothetical protein
MKTQRFGEPLQDARALKLWIGSQVRRWLPVKRTMTQPCNLRLFSAFHGGFVHKRTATFCGAAKRRDRAPSTLRSRRRSRRSRRLSSLPHFVAFCMKVGAFCIWE